LSAAAPSWSAARRYGNWNDYFLLEDRNFDRGVDAVALAGRSRSAT
jgi:hypothetical protein